MMFRFFAFLLLLTTAFSSSAIEQSDLLEPDKAFQFFAKLVDPQTIEVRYVIADDYYLYRQNFRFESESKNISLASPSLPEGKVKDDPFFGKVVIYRGNLQFKIPFTQSASTNSLHLKIISQGCADSGVCYAPQLHRITLPLSISASTTQALTPFEQLLQGKQDGFIKGTTEPFSVTSEQNKPPVDESAQITNLLKEKNLFLIVLSFLGFGLLLSFTPCVLPMVPILSSIIVGRSHSSHKLHTFILSLSYVLGMASIYALVGVIAGLSGTFISASLQNPWVLGSFSIVLVILAFSMFGFYDLQLPHHLRNKLAHLSKRIHGGNLIAVFIMGGISAIIVSPCVAPPLAGALLYISQTQNAWLGGIALFSLAIGMGIPLLLVGISAGTLIPKKGAWMNSVKYFFGALLLALAIWIISPLIPISIQMLLWSALLIIFAIYLNALNRLSEHASGFSKLLKAIGIIFLIIGIAMLIGALSGSKNILQPLSGLQMANEAENSVRFERIKSAVELEQRLKNTDNKYVMLDFYADWCVSCKEMEKFTFADQKVAAKLNKILLLQVDVTNNTSFDQALLAKFNLFGPPGIIFFDPKGQEIQGAKVIGFQNSEKFLNTLNSVIP